MRKILLFLLCSFLVLTLVSCSSDDKKTQSTTSLPREITNEEAQLFSTALSNNALDKNASISIVSGAFGSGGFSAKGKVDWEHQIVELNISLVDPAQIDLASVTKTDGVFEKFAGLESAIISAGIEPKQWVLRNFDPSVYGTDALAQFMVKLGAASPDNPILLKQNGAQYLGTQEIEDSTTLMFQNSESITYFLTKEGELKKVTARIKGFNNDIEIYFSDRQQTQISVPATTDSIPFESISELYSKSRPAF